MAATKFYEIVAGYNFNSKKLIINYDEFNEVLSTRLISESQYVGEIITTGGYINFYVEKTDRRAGSLVVAINGNEIITVIDTEAAGQGTVSLASYNLGSMTNLNEYDTSFDPKSDGYPIFYFDEDDTGGESGDPGAGETDDGQSAYTEDLLVSEFLSGYFIGNQLRIVSAGNTQQVQKSCNIYFYMNRQKYLLKIIQVSNNAPSCLVQEVATGTVIYAQQSMTTFPYIIPLPNVAWFLKYETPQDVGDISSNITITKYSYSGGPIHRLLWRFLGYLERMDRRLDYCIDIVGRKISLPQATFTSSVSGLTCQSSCEAYLIGNMLHVYFNLALTTAAQNTIGTGNINNKEIVTVSIPNAVYHGRGLPPDEAINYFRYGPSTSISAVNGMDNTIATGTSYTSKMASFHATLNTGSLTTEEITEATVTLSIDAVQAASSRYHFAIDIPISRAYCL